MLHTIERAIQMALVFAFIAMLAYVMGLQDGRQYERSGNPVCHAKSEDSLPFDCDYTNGGWYRK